MITWEAKCWPPSCDINDECNQYYLVKTENNGVVKAMFIGGEWWTSYISKLMVKVVGWTEI